MTATTAALVTVRIPAVSIHLHRGEGPRTPDVTHLGTDPWAGNLTVWQRANHTLWRWAYSAPKSGGYDKCDVTVTWANGETYEARMDIKHPSCSGNDLDVAAHIRQHVGFYSGLVRPYHLTPAQYTAALAYTSEAERAECVAYLETYQIGGES